MLIAAIVVVPLPGKAAGIAHDRVVNDPTEPVPVSLAAGAANLDEPENAFPLSLSRPVRRQE
jgi:hypothetical protein